MTVKEFCEVIMNPDRIRIIQGNNILYAGYLGVFRNEKKKENQYILHSEVKKFRASTEIRHRKWKELGLDAPMMPEMTPQYNFKDLQETLYYDIYI
jgi:hypothetical protein